MEAYVGAAAAYLHDAGMVTSDEEKEEILLSDAWKGWISEGSGCERWAQIEAFRKGGEPPDEPLVRSSQRSPFLWIALGVFALAVAVFIGLRISLDRQVTNLADPEILRSWSQQKELPSCAIGGITAANLAPLVQAGANLLAIIGGVWNHAEGPAAGVRAINAAIKAAMDRVA